MTAFSAAIHPDCHHAQLRMEKEKEEELRGGGKGKNTNNKTVRMFGVLQNVINIPRCFAVGILSLSFSSCSPSLSRPLPPPTLSPSSSPFPSTVPFASSPLPSSLSASSLTRSSLVRWDYAKEPASAVMHTHTQTRTHTNAVDI